MLNDRIGCFGTCGISHRWSSSRDDCSRSSSSNNSDIEDLLEAGVIVRLFRSAAYIPIKATKTHMLDDWTSAAMALSHLAAVHPPSISPPRPLIQQPATNRIRFMTSCAQSNSSTMLTLHGHIGWFLCHCFPSGGWLRHAATYSEARYLPRLIRTHRVPTRPP